MRNRRKTEQNKPVKERFYVTLTPEDFRQGAKNKKINTVNLNSNGILVGGSARGDIFMWKIEFSQFKTKQLNKISHYIGNDIVL